MQHVAAMWQHAASPQACVPEIVGQMRSLTSFARHLRCCARRQRVTLGGGLGVVWKNAAGLRRRLQLRSQLSRMPRCQSCEGSLRWNRRRAPGQGMADFCVLCRCAVDSRLNRLKAAVSEYNTVQYSAVELFVLLRRRLCQCYLSRPSILKPSVHPFPIQAVPLRDRLSRLRLRV